MCDKACGHGAACASAPTDCVGAWSTCTATCIDRVYVISAAETNGGRACPVADGTLAACSPGDGSCPCADALPLALTATNEDCAALVAGTADGCDGVVRDGDVSSPVDELCPATCNSCCADTLDNCGGLLAADLATCADNFIRFSTFDGGADAGRCDSTCHFCHERCMDNPSFADAAGNPCTAHRGFGCDDPGFTGGTSPEDMKENCPYSCGVCSVRTALCLPARGLYTEANPTRLCLQGEFRQPTCDWSVAPFTFSACCATNDFTADSQTCTYETTTFANCCTNLTPAPTDCSRMRDGTLCDDADIGTVDDVCASEVCIGAALDSPPPPPPPPSPPPPPPPPPSTCVDDLTWESGGFGCIDHRPTQDNGAWTNYCDDAAVQEACPLSCGICSVRRRAARFSASVALIMACRYQRRSYNTHLVQCADR